MLVKTDDLPHEVRYTKTDAIISAIGATLLIVSEMLGAIVAFAWAVGSMLGLGETLILFNTSTAPVTANVEVGAASAAWSAARGACPAAASAPGSIRVTVPALDYMICTSEGPR